MSDQSEVKIYNKILLVYTVVNFYVSDENKGWSPIYKCLCKI